MIGIRRMMQNLRHRIGEQREAGQMNDDACRDFGMTAGDLTAALTMKIDVPDRMRRMSAVFGAAPALARADRWQLLDMARACDRCKHRRACARALDGDGQAGTQNVAFCPNAGEYRAMTAHETD
ncbi:MAG: hypothetical protein LBE86_04960 [Gemmobacter sp.]|jgi:hypothetical protein|nr:hypothetical protein [Gemmobacter sp.]